MSISEALALGKIPFYEVRKHKKNFWESLKLLANHYHKSKIVKFTDEIVENSSNFCLEESELVQEFKDLFTIISQYHNRGDMIKALIYQRVLHKKYPKLKVLEDGLIHAYKEKQISAVQVNAYLNQIINFL